MVKGNWQHRVEKAERRKAERKERKELREKGLLVEPLDVLNALFRGDPDPEVWLVAPERPKLCAAHFFDDGCTNRRCKWSHAETLGPYTARCAVAAPTETTARAVARLARVDEQLFPSAARRRRAPSTLAGRCWTSSSAFRPRRARGHLPEAPRRVARVRRRGRGEARGGRCCSRQRSLRRAASRRAASGAALAFDAGADDVWRSFAGGAAPRPGPAVPRAPRVLPDASAAGLAAGSKALRAAAKADPAMRARRCLEAAEEQGKKKKQGKSSGGKKDGFARGNKTNETDYAA
ncbi:hypothetical protein JL721_8819 [Aureococcus anophagefferens]|nr:hypothetical protein JL721_8819 [Aureococcus anophagefferens]